jgi:two-component system, cell cycle sensor histidine kinase and response regulator CckA
MSRSLSNKSVDMAGPLSQVEAMIQGLRTSRSHGVLVWDLDGRIAEANPAFCQMLGYSEAELQNLTYKQITPVHWHAMEDALLSDRLRGGGSCEVYDKEYRRKNGLSLAVETHTFVMRDAAGRPAGMWAMVSDLSQRQRAEQELARVKALLESALEQSPAGILIADASDTTICMANRVSQEMMGMSLSEQLTISMENVGPLQCLYPDGSPLAMEDAPLAQALTRGRTVRNMEMGFRRPDGAEFWVLANGAPVRDASGAQIGAICVFLDITEQKQAQARQLALERQLAQAQRLDSIGQLAGGISHDFNNALTVIQCNLSMALLGLTKGQALYDLIAEAYKAADSAAGLTRQLLVFARPQPLEQRLIDPNFLIDRMQKLLGRLIGEHIVLVTKLGPDVGSIRADVGQLEQVIVNLVVNARDSMPGGGSMTIETRAVDIKAGDSELAPGPYVMLAVSDTGCGMPDKVRRRAFEPFFSTKARGRGTGLGLSIVFGIVKQHGGAIELSSEVGQGSCVQILFPRVEQPPESLRLEPQTLAQLRGGDETILVVEDDVPVRDFAVKLLRSLGYRVIEAVNGAEAAQAARAYRRNIQLLVTDVIMPRIDGVTLAKTLRQACPELKVLFTSGYLDTTVLPDPDLTAEVHFLGKPYNAHLLAEKVRDILDLDT